MDKEHIHQQGVLDYKEKAKAPSSFEVPLETEGAKAVLLPAAGDAPEAPLGEDESSVATGADQANILASNEAIARAVLERTAKAKKGGSDEGDVQMSEPDVELKAAFAEAEEDWVMEAEMPKASQEQGEPASAASSFMEVDKTSWQMEEGATAGSVTASSQTPRTTCTNAELVADFASLSLTEIPDGARKWNEAASSAPSDGSR